MRLGLLSKVALALAVVGLSPVAVITWQMTSLNRDAMTTQVLRTHAVASRTAAERVAAYLSAVLVPVQAALGTPEFERDPRSGESQSLLAGLLQAQPGLLAVEVTDPAGGRAYLLQRRERADAVAGALAAGPPGGSRVLDQGTGLVVAIDLPLEGGAGWARVVARGEGLAEALSPAEMGQDAQMALFDRVARVQFLPPAGGQAGDGFPERQRQAAFTGRVSGTGRFDDALGAFAPVPGRDWVVLSRQPARVAEELALRTRRRAWLAALTAAALAIGFSGLAYAAIVKPVRQLLAAQRRLVGGDPAADGGNELQALRRSFEVLAQRVREKADLAGLSLGRYVVERVLGQGAMGTVFLARDPKLERQVAIKTIKLNEELPQVVREELVEVLLREARVIAGIAHPNIVAVYDVEVSSEAPYVAMEFVEGGTLDGVIRERGRLDPGTALHMALGIARGLEAAHQLGVIHHDIKPANVLVRRDGVVKIMDFGIAGAVSELAEQRRQIFGTPGYLPPETLQGGGAGPLGDVFALGVSLYECLSGVRPYVGRDLRAILAATVRGQARPLAELVPDLPEPLVKLVAELMNPAPEGRTPSARAARERLEAVERSMSGAATTAVIPDFALEGLTEPPPSGEHRTRVFQAPDLRTMNQPRSR